MDKQQLIKNITDMINDLPGDIEIYAMPVVLNDKRPCVIFPHGTSYKDLVYLSHIFELKLGAIRERDAMVLKLKQDYSEEALETTIDRIVEQHDLKGEERAITKAGIIQEFTHQRAKYMKEYGIKEEELLSDKELAVLQNKSASLN